MASPLSIFRKYNQLFMVFLVLLALGAFVIVPSIQGWITSQARTASGADEVVVTWKGGRMTASELDKMRQSHRLAVYYLSAVVGKTIEKEGQPQGVTRNNMGQIVDPGIPSSEAAVDIVYTHLLAQRAEEIGLVISDEAIREFLDQLSDGKLTGNDLQEIFESTLGGRFTSDFLFQQLRTELLAQKMRSMMMAGLYVPPPSSVTPIAAWDYFRRLNRRVTAEVTELPVSDYVAKVSGNPTQEEITAIYEEGKDQYPYLDSPDPGFRERKKVNFQFVRANFNDFLEEEKEKIKDTITDEAIEKHYNDNKQRYRISETEAELTDPEAGSDNDGGAADGKAESGTESAGGESAEEAAPAEGDAKPEAPAAEATSDPQPSEGTSEQPAEEASEAPATTEETPAEETPAEETPAAEEPGSDDNGCVQEETPADDAPATPEQEPAAEQPGTEQPAAEAPAQETPADTPAKEAPAETPQEQPAAEAETTETESPATEKSPATESAAESAEQAATEATEAPAEPEAKFRPLDDELREEIRKELIEIEARQPAQTRLDAALSEVRKQVSRFVRRSRKEQSDSSELFPTPLDLSSLELDPLLTSGETGLVDALTINDRDSEDNPVHEISITSQFQMQPPFGSVPFSDLAFDESPQYSPEEISGSIQVKDEEGQETSQRLTYLYWKREEVPERTPSIEEANRAIVDYWKQQKALELAEADAEKLSKEVESSGKTLADFFGSERRVDETNEFSWISSGFTPASFGGRPGLSNVDFVKKEGEEKSKSVQGIGNAFMESVFALQPGQTGVAINQPQNVVYLVRLIGESVSENQLKDRFLESGITQDMAFIANGDIMTRLREWYDTFESDMAIEWLKNDLDG